MEQGILDSLQAPALDIAGVLRTEGLKGQLRQVRDLLALPYDVIEECLGELHDIEEAKEEDPPESELDNE